MKIYIPGVNLMSTGMLRYLDRLLGKPASRMLLVIKKMFRRQRIVDELQQINPKKILLIKLWGI